MSKKVTHEELTELTNQAQHSTLLAIMWSSSDEGFTSAKQLGAYFMKWIDATKAAVESMGDPEQTEKLVKDLTTIIVTPVAGARAALREYAKANNVTLTPSKLTGKEDPLTFKKLALVEIEESMKAIKEVKKS